MTKLLIIGATLLGTFPAYPASVPRDENSIAAAIDACVESNQADDINQRLILGSIEPTLGALI